MASILGECKGLIETRNRESLSLLAQVEAALDVYATALAHACSSLNYYLTRVASLLEIQEREAKSVKQAHHEKLSNLHSEFLADNHIQEVYCISINTLYFHTYRLLKENLKRILEGMQAEVDDEELYRQLQKALDTLRVIEEVLHHNLIFLST